MPMHPSPPEDLHGLVEAFAHTAQAVLDLGHGCREEEFDLPTSCAGWTVKDQISHVVAVEALLDGEPQPELELPAHEHVRSDVARFMEVGVEARRPRSGADVVAELEHILERRLSALRSPGLTETSIVAGPTGTPTEAADLLQIRAIDVWVHEQDLREVLRRPGNLDSPAATVFMARLNAALPKLVATRADLDPGQAVILESTGPVVSRDGVRVEEGEDGRLVGHALFTGEAVDEEELPYVEGPTTSISLSTDQLTRRAAGRRSVEDTRYHVTGDEEVARRVLASLVITP